MWSINEVGERSAEGFVSRSLFRPWVLRLPLFRLALSLRLIALSLSSFSHILYGRSVFKKLEVLTCARDKRWTCLKF